jgi:hypothetical protein
MGKAIIRELAREIIQPWYGSRKFIIGKGRGANNNGCGLNQFLATDFWGIGLELAKSLQNIDSHYFDDITAAQRPRTAGSSLTRERREDLSVDFRRLITPKPVGAYLNITLYTEDMGTAYKEGLGVPILETGLDMLLPILGELQKVGWEISLILTGVSKDSFRLFNWLKNPQDLGGCSVADLLISIDSFYRVDRLGLEL